MTAQHVQSSQRRKPSKPQKPKSRRLIFENLEARTVFTTGGLMSPDPFFNQNPAAYPSFPNTDLPILHSNPGAGAVIYMGFQGGIASNGDYFPPSDFETKGTSTTSQTVSTGSKTFVTQAGLSFEPGHRIHINSDANNKNFMNAIVTSYSGTSLVVNVDAINGSGTATAWTITNTHFTLEEREQIINLWRQFAGQFAIFNIDVTTDPVDLATKPSTYIGFRSYGNGGVGLNSFASPPSPGATLFTTDVPRYATAIGPHEVGHTFDLRHQANFNTVGLVSAEYGTAFSPIYFPIMGNRTDGNSEAHMMKWIYGQGWDSISVAQDDIAKFAGTLTSKGVSPFRTTEMDQSPDYGGTIATATPLTSLGNNAFAHNGIISTMSDIDMFSFTPTTSGYYDIMLGRNSSTADLALKIFDNGGNLLASEDGDATIAPTRNVYDQHITRFFTAGTTYYLSAESHGNYADMGQYIIRASFVGDSSKPWRAEDVGFVGLPGYSHFNTTNNTYTIAGAGADFGMDFNLHNGFQMLTQQLQGDGQITVQMTNVDGPNEWSLGGIIIRSNVEGDDSQYVALAMTKEHGYVRYADNGSNARTAPIFQSAGPKIGFTPRYLRITRVGNTFSFSHSTTGASFTAIGGSITIAMGSVVNIGMFSTGTGNANIPLLAGAPVNNSLQEQRLATSTFANVSVIATGSGVLNPNSFANLNNFISPVLSANSSTSNSITFSWNTALTPGDTNGDGLVNIVDYNNVKNNFGGSGLGDTNYDGVVNIVDFNNVKNNFGALGGGATGYIIERSEDGVNYTSVNSSLSATTLNYTDASGLHDFERYYYRVRAKKADGSVSAPSNVISSVTRAGAVTGIHPSTTGTNGIVLRWDDVDGDTGYRVWRATSENGTYTQVGGTLSANQTLRNDNSGKSANQTYWYKIETLDSLGSAAMSEAFPLDTRWTGTQVGTVTASNITSSSVDLNWADFTSGTPATSYVIYRGLQANGSQYYGETSIATTTLSQFSDSGLSPGTTYFYQVYAVNSSGRLSAPRSRAVTTTNATSSSAESPLSTSPSQASQISTMSVTRATQKASMISELNSPLSQNELIGTFAASIGRTESNIPSNTETKTSASAIRAIPILNLFSRAQAAAVIRNLFATDYGKLGDSLTETFFAATKKNRSDLGLNHTSKKIEVELLRRVF